MEGHSSSITELAVVVVGALACGLVMRRFRQPILLGYILAGAALGPSGLGLVQSREQVQLLAELGVLMLLFFIGMELNLRDFRAVWKVAVLTTAFQIAAALRPGGRAVIISSCPAAATAASRSAATCGCRFRTAPLRGLLPAVLRRGSS